MKHIYLSLLILSFHQLVFAQTNAVTESGDEVILYEDGTWKYVNDNLLDEPIILTNDKKFLKDENSTFLVKSTILNIGVWIDPKLWKFSKSSDDDDSEYFFERKGEDLYAMLIAERAQIPILTLRNIAIENAMSAAPDLKIDKEEYRNVNGMEILMMQMSGTIQGLQVNYFGYYYSSSKGTIQFLTYTTENLFNDYFDDIDLFINGLVEL